MQPENFPIPLFFRGKQELSLHKSNFYKFLCFGCKFFNFRVFFIQHEKECKERGYKQHYLPVKTNGFKNCIQVQKKKSSDSFVVFIHSGAFLWTNILETELQNGNFIWLSLYLRYWTLLSYEKDVLLTSFFLSISGLSARKARTSQQEALLSQVASRKPAGMNFEVF